MHFIYTIYQILTSFLTADSFETALIDHQSLADYFSSKRKQQVINADKNHQIHHSIKLLNDPKSQENVFGALSLVKNKGSDLGNNQKKEERYNLRNKKVTVTFVCVNR